MEFIVENLAKATAAQQQAEVHAARADRRIHGLQTLMKLGMKRLARWERGIAAQQKGLAAQHKRTDQKFGRWLDSLQGGNGHKKRRPS